MTSLTRRTPTLIASDVPAELSIQETRSLWSQRKTRSWFAISRRFWERPSNGVPSPASTTRPQLQNARLNLPGITDPVWAVSYTHLRAHETRHDLVCRLLLE